ncbi:hypothetical protein HZA97_08695 [Candidatus Woesearchaeota archaeon]|nr:hypothetical protein [Candidatus Woesearchaeota archaeon]
MKIKEGSRVVITKNLGPENEYTHRYSNEYYYESDTLTIPLKSKGIVTTVDDEDIWVKFKGDDEEYRFHRKELKLFEQTTDFKPSSYYLFSLASQTPVFILNDRLYVLGEAQSELEKNFFQTTRIGKQNKFSLVESASLKSLEELSESHFSEEYEKVRNDYLKEVVENLEEKEDGNQETEEDYILVNFIVNKVFPHLRQGEIDSSKINKLLGVKNVQDQGELVSEFSTENSAHERKRESFFSKLIQKIEKEKIPVKKEKKRKEKKVDQKLNMIFGYEPDLEVDVASLPKNYEPESIFGRLLEGRNIAIIDNQVYYLAENKEADLEKILNFEGKNYSLVSPVSIDEVKNKFYFELSKKIRIETIRNKAANDKRIREFLENNSNLESLVRKEEYKEEDFGFIREDYGEYNVFLQVPKHVLKMPDDYVFEEYDYYDDDDDYDEERKSRKKTKKKDRYYLFDKVRVAVKLFVEDGEIAYNNESFTIEEDYSDPFCDREVCLGDYNYSQLAQLEPGLAVAKFLKDTRRTILSGYVSGNTAPRTALENFEGNRITPSQIKKRNLPITNINLGG